MLSTRPTYENMTQEEFTCPYCSRTMPLIREVHKRYKVGMNKMIEVEGEIDSNPGVLSKEECMIQIDFMRCPSCKNHTITQSLARDIQTTFRKNILKK